MDTELKNLKMETQEVENQQIKLSVEIPPEMVKAEIDHAYLLVGKKAKIKGFRPGKIPRPVLESYFREEAEAHAIEHLVEDTYPAALAQKSLEPASRPRIETDKFAADQPFRYHVTFAVLPKVEARRYRDLSVEKPRFPVPEEEVTANLEKLRSGQVQLKVVEENRPVKKDDHVVLDYRVLLPGEKKEKAQKSVTVQVGTNRFLPDMEEALLGMKREEQKEVRVTFPADHPQKGLSGKAATMNLKVHEIKEAILPELNDDFAREVSSYKTLPELTGAIRAGLEKESQNREERELKNRLLAQLRERNPVTLAPAAVEERAQFLLYLMQSNLGQQGLAFNLETEEGKKLLERFQEEAAHELQNEILFNSIAAQEKIEISAEEIEAKLGDPKSRQGGKNPEEEQEKLKNQARQELLRERIFALLLANAKIKE
ncbi:MAG: trigger factor [Proteobacteria bacterium]|nr:trigger factor [Pseudomonadota bacterium]